MIVFAFQIIGKYIFLHKSATISMLFDYRYQKEYLKKKTDFHKDQKYFL